MTELNKIDNVPGPSGSWMSADTENLASDPEERGPASFPVTGPLGPVTYHNNTRD